MKIYLSTSLCLLFSFSGKYAAAISVTDTSEVFKLFDNLLDGSVIIKTALLKGGQGCAGLFTEGTAVTDTMPESGIILSSGLVKDVEGPNTDPATTTDHGSPGDLDLNGLISGSPTQDACILTLEFDCPAVPSGINQDISFNYVFASEEYNEGVDQDRNDVFGAILNDRNIAVLPHSSGTPVAVDYVNNGDYSEYYNDNDYDDFDGSPPFDIQADGFTDMFAAVGPTVTGTNTIKLAIADAGDGIVDSWVLLEEGSYTCTSKNCIEHKGCSPDDADRRALCHRQSKRVNTLCLPVESIATHLAEHRNDSCGCCDAREEKRRPDFCDE